MLIWLKNVYRVFLYFATDMRRDRASIHLHLHSAPIATATTTTTTQAQTWISDPDGTHKPRHSSLGKHFCSFRQIEREKKKEAAAAKKREKDEQSKAGRGRCFLQCDRVAFFVVFQQRANGRGYSAATSPTAGGATTTTTTRQQQWRSSANNTTTTARTPRTFSNIQRYSHC